MQRSRPQIFPFSRQRNDDCLNRQGDIAGGLRSKTPMVGSNGLEPSTSRLSGVRSNHLSYEPISVAVRCAIRPNRCFSFAPTASRDYRLPFRSDCSATWLGDSPWWRRTESNCRPPACKAGALPAELRPRIRFVPLGKSTLFEFPEGPQN